MDLFYRKMWSYIHKYDIQIETEYVIVFNVHTHAHYRCDPSKQGAASVMRLKDDSDRVKEVRIHQEAYEQ